MYCGVMTEHNHPRRTRIEQGARTVVAGLLALAFAFFGLSKVTADPTQVAMFQGWGYPLWFMYLVGAAEIGAAALLAVPSSRFYGAAAVVGLMAGGFATHAFAGELMQLPLPLMTGAAAGLVAVLTRPSWSTDAAGNRAQAEAGDGA
jgi:hypothetical protein